MRWESSHKQIKMNGYQHIFFNKLEYFYKVILLNWFISNQLSQPQLSESKHDLEREQRIFLVPAPKMDHLYLIIFCLPQIRVPVETSF